MSAARKALDGLEDTLDAGAFYDASLCVSELVTNVILHADMAPEDELRLDVTLDDGRLHVAVSDNGEGFAPLEPIPGDEGGWGLFIVDRLSERWGVEREGATRVWFEMALASGETAPARSEPAEQVDGAGHDDHRAERGVRRRFASGLRVRPQTSL